MTPAAPARNLALVPLAQAVVRTLTAQGLTCATAESCTGGLVGHLLTEVSGSSACFGGSAVTYSDAAKQRVLGVPTRLLQTRGAVSAEVAQAMAAGARDLYVVDIAVSVTGVAGPGGGSAEKPVGTVYLHVQGPEQYGRGARYVWTEDRTGNKRCSAQAALQLILDCAQALPVTTS